MRKRIDIGEFRWRVALQSCTVTSGKLGGVTETWGTYATVWANISTPTGRSVFYGHQIKPETTHQIMIRYRSDITAKHRVLYGSRVFVIDAVVDPDERKWVQIIDCHENP